MSRLARNDDSSRLPEDMERVGYDADTQTYSYRDSSGQYWEGGEGARYGVLRPVGRGDERDHEDRLALLEDEENGTRRRRLGLDDGGQAFLRAQDRSAWRYMLPFFLVCIVVLLILFKFLNGGTSSSAPSQSLNCPENTIKYVIKKGDTCMEIAKAHGTTVNGLIAINRDNGMECNRLEVGGGLCVPGGDGEVE